MCTHRGKSTHVNTVELSSGRPDEMPRAHATHSCNDMVSFKHWASHNWELLMSFLLSWNLNEKDKHRGIVSSGFSIWIVPRLVCWLLAWNRWHMGQMRVGLGAGRRRQKNGCVSHLASPPRLSSGLISALTKQIANNFNYLCIQSLSPSTTPHFACANERKRGVERREA